MKVISTFLFSEIHEQNVLWTKLSCESSGVDKWIAIESPYSFRGNPKPVNIKEILQEKRFEPFQDRINIITIQDNLFKENNLTHCEKDYFVVEKLSRAACMWSLDNYPDDTRVLVGDVDELIDFSNEARKNEFFKICKEYDGSWQAKQMKFWWDYDNLSFYPKYMPVHTLGSLRAGKTSFAPRNDHCKTIPSENMLAFEYAYSFDLAGNFSKVSTFSHDRYNQECIEQAWLGNSWHKTQARNERLGDQAWDWFETIELNETNAPLFVLENLDKLKVNTVNPDYATYRVANGFPPHPAMNMGFLMKNRIKKIYNYYKK